MLKTFSVILLILILYFALIKPTFAASPYNETYSDPYVAFTENYSAIQRDFILRLNYAYANGSISQTQFTNVINYLTNGRYLAYFMYGTSSNSYNNASPQSFETITLYFVPRAYINAVSYNADYFGINGISQYTITNSTNTSNANAYRYRFNITTFNSSLLSGVDGYTLYAPYLYLEYIDPFVSDYLTQVYSNGEVNDTLVQILNMTTSINSHTEATEQNTDDIKDFLSDTSANDSSFNRTPISTPSDSVSESVDSIFYMFQEAFRC